MTHLMKIMKKLANFQTLCIIMSLAVVLMCAGATALVILSCHVHNDDFLCTPLLASRSPGVGVILRAVFSFIAVTCIGVAVVVCVSVWWFRRSAVGVSTLGLSHKVSDDRTGRQTPDDCDSKILITDGTIRPDEAKLLIT